MFLILLPCCSLNPCNIKFKPRSPSLTPGTCHNHLSYTSWPIIYHSYDLRYLFFFLYICTYTDMCVTQELQKYTNLQIHRHANRCVNLKSMWTIINGFVYCIYIYIYKPICHFIYAYRDLNVFAQHIYIYICIYIYIYIYIYKQTQKCTYIVEWGYILQPRGLFLLFLFVSCSLMFVTCLDQCSQRKNPGQVEIGLNAHSWEIGALCMPLLFSLWAHLPMICNYQQSLTSWPRNPPKIYLS